MSKSQELKPPSTSTGSITILTNVVYVPEGGYHLIYNIPEGVVSLAKVSAAYSNLTITYTIDFLNTRLHGEFHLLKIA